MFGGAFEHSPWIAEAVWDTGLTGRHDSATGLHQSFREVIRQSGREEKLALLRAHPELAVGIASDEQLTGSSQREQRGAGLDRCSPDEFSEFRKLNDSYREKFGFPFIMAVKGFNRRRHPGVIPGPAGKYRGRGIPGRCGTGDPDRTVPDRQPFQLTTGT